MKVFEQLKEYYMPNRLTLAIGRNAHVIKLSLALFIIPAFLCIVALALNKFVGPADLKMSSASPVASSTGKKRPASGGTVHRAQLLPNLRDALGVLGNRLTVSGKERLVLTGTLRRTDDSAARPFVAIHELPGRVRFEEGGQSQPLMAVFDGNETWKTGGRPTRVEEDILETLAYDSAESLFIASAAGAGIRFLGSRFSLNQEVAGASQPVYDIYQLTDQIKTRNEIQSRTKSFYLNSDTLLLERVRYQLQRDGTQTDVEVRFSDWRDIQGQKVPFSITRTETGAPTITLTLNFVSVGPQVKDGAFTKPSANQ